ncbi:MAG: dimethyl sulfoxide reductase anchor subunit [Rhodospirillales bacterium]|jgi:DMSO reductase anchor subunit|nr:dimethyl sulfoxide reductase anchor subunit [Rhodospirillales bacterium]
MKPAFSVLFLTTLIGMGQGLLIALVAGQFYFVIGSGSEQDSGLFFATGAAVGLALLGLGLVASFFHLTHPERGMRSIMRWRTSWLSREVLLLPACMGLAFLYGVAHWFGFAPVLMTFGNQKSLDLTMAIGFLLAASCAFLFIATGMIYACVRFIKEWATPWTVINYTLIGLSSGFAACAIVAAVENALLRDFLAGWAALFTLLAFAAKGVTLWRNKHLPPPFTLKSAIGVHHGSIRQLSQGFNGRSFNTTEFFTRIGPEVKPWLIGLMLVFGFAAPSALLLAGWADRYLPALIAALPIQYIGLLTERWLFFAQGQHVQNVYYQRKS